MIWERPYECDRWVITTKRSGRYLFSRRPKFIATAKGYRNGEIHAHYTMYLSGRVPTGRSHQEAEAKMRKRICEDIQRYKGWLDREYQEREYHSYKAEDICPSRSTP